jgi:hypothetical protein
VATDSVRAARIQCRQQANKRMERLRSLLHQVRFRGSSPTSNLLVARDIRYQIANGLSDCRSRPVTAGSLSRRD